jgi:putative ABC transport system permease protein
VIVNALRIALSQLRRNLVRSALTSLGILIGVAAVIVMVGLGRGASASIENDLKSLGSNLLFVTPGTDRGPRSHSSVAASPFSIADAEAVSRSVAHVRAVAPQVQVSVTAVAGSTSYKTSATGSWSSFLQIQSWTLAEGREFTLGEERAGASVCILGATVSKELFGSGSPLASELRLGRLTCTVVGLLAPKGKSTMGMDQDDFVLMPITTLQRRLVGKDDVSFILVSVDDEDHMAQVSKDLDTLFRERRHVTSDAALDFQVMDTREITSFIGGIMQVLTLFLAAVASVSLLVGGIGIMNIMLVSVTERTREIGIRLAIGALESDVLTQFLVEAMVLSGFGGVLGVLLGLLGSFVGARLMDIPFVADPALILLAVAFSGLVGVVFGFWPARRAAKMRPIDALRYE